MRGEPIETSSNIKLIATASEGAKEFRLWKLNLETQTLHPYLKIETTISGGIKYLVESQDTQIVAANEKCIKFYDFIDKSDKQARDKDAAEKKELNKKMKDIFESVDTNNLGKLDRK